MTIAAIVHKSQLANGPRCKGLVDKTIVRAVLVMAGLFCGVAVAGGRRHGDVERPGADPTGARRADLRREPERLAGGTANVLGAVFAHGHAGAGEEHLLHKGVGAVSALKDHCSNWKARVREKVACLLEALFVDLLQNRLLRLLLEEARAETS